MPLIFRNLKSNKDWEGCNTKKLHKLIWIFLPQAALKGLNIPAWGNAPGKNYIFPKSPERATHKNKYMSRPFQG